MHRTRYLRRGTEEGREVDRRNRVEQTLAVDRGSVPPAAPVGHQSDQRPAVELCGKPRHLAARVTCEVPALPSAAEPVDGLRNRRHARSLEDVLSLGTVGRIEHEPVDPTGITPCVGQRDMRAVGGAKDRNPLRAERLANGVDVIGQVRRGVEVAARAELGRTLRDGSGLRLSRLQRRAVERTGTARAALIHHDDVARAGLRPDEIAHGLAIKRPDSRSPRASSDQEQRRAGRALGFLALDAQLDGAGNGAAAVERDGEGGARAVAVGALAGLERCRSLGGAERQSASKGG
jgi:hypothetical protein